MKNISIDNGATYTTAVEALQHISLDAMVPYMDDDIRETVNAELAPCSNAEFLTRYLELAKADLIIG